MDLDYRALSNAGVWCIGRLQTDADRARVLDGLAGASSIRAGSEAELGRHVQRLAPRWFIVKNAHIPNVEPLLLRPRDTMTLMRGPMTRSELLQPRQWRASLEGTELPPNGGVKLPAAVAQSAAPPRFGFAEGDG